MRGESPVAGFSEIGFHPPSSACLKLKGPLKAVLVACPADLAIEQLRGGVAGIQGAGLLPGGQPEQLDQAEVGQIESFADQDHLPRRQRQVITLRYVLDMSEDDVATTLGITRGTVKATSSHGLSAMRKVLGADFGATPASPVSCVPGQDGTF